MANAVSKIDDKYFQIAVSEGSDEATMLLYSNIGPMWEYDENYNRIQTGVTDIEFVRELTALAAKHTRINLRINSLGGSVVHGAAICAAIQNCKAEVHTYNDGYCASMGAQIWFAAKHRHMAANALLMTHAPSTWLVGNAKQMRDSADMLDKMTESSAIHIAQMTGKKTDEVMARFFKSDKDEWLTAADCRLEGLVTDADEYESASVIAGAQQMTLGELFQKLEKKPSAVEPSRLSGGLLAQLAQLITPLMQPKKVATEPEENIPAAAPVVEPQTATVQQQSDLEMTKTDFQAALADGTLGIAEVAKALEAKGFLVTPPAEPTQKATDGDDEFFKKLQTQIDALQSANAALTQKVEAFAAAPGAARSNPAAPEGDPGGIDPVKAEMDAYNAKMEAAAADGRSPFATR